MTTLTWAADFSKTVQDSKRAGFRIVHTQTASGSIKTREAIDLIEAPHGLGRGLELELHDNDKRLEVLPPAHEARTALAVRFGVIRIW